MKANRKFKDGEEAVSAVIGVILMVAITVAIAATVYVYVSGMIGGESEVTPVITFSRTDQATTNTLTVISADPGDLDWGDLVLKVGGTTTAHGQTGNVEAGDIITISTTGDYTVTIAHTPSNTLVGSFDFT